VLEAITDDSLHLAAAAMADGINAGYLEYLYQSDEAVSGFEKMNGGAPVGEGLLAWLHNAPLFKTDRIKTPLLETAFGDTGLFIMWEPFAALRHQHKPVDLLLLDTHEHVLSNPSAEMASQSANVDWLRYWLQGYEDPDPAKVVQYRRWERLCNMQIAANTSLPTHCVPSGQSPDLSKPHTASSSN
jgi:hypothetical protein